MNLDNINRLGRELYRDPALAVPMRDALEDLGISWQAWMEQSGTLDRLAECMIVALDGRIASPDILRDYLKTIGFFRATVKRLRHIRQAEYVPLARALHIPPVLVRVQFAVVDNSEPSVAEYRYHWHPPSQELAREIIRRTHEFSVKRQGLDEAILALEVTRGKFFEELRETVRGHHPDARGYQMCFGNGQWISRRPAVWNPPDCFNSDLLDVFDD